MLRSGVWTRQQFFERLTNEIRKLEYDPGRYVMSAEDSSFHAWFYDRSPQMQQTNFANTTINYYNKGALIGLLLDLEIRARTRGEKSLDDVVLSLYKRFYQPAGSDSPEPAGGYEDRDILAAVNEVAGTDLTGFFDRYVRGTERLDYSAALGHAGLKLEIRTSADAAPTLGVLGQQTNGGFSIAAVLTGGAADLAGLSRGDLIVDVDGVSIEFSELRNHLRIYPPGAEVPLGIERHGRRERITVKLDPPIADQYSIVELPEANDAQLRLRRGWLGE
jgi:predicted metalloprotease with PDZ domain